MGTLLLELKRCDLDILQRVLQSLGKDSLHDLYQDVEAECLPYMGLRAELQHIVLRHHGNDLHDVEVLILKRLHYSPDIVVVVGLGQHDDDRDMRHTADLPQPVDFRLLHPAACRVDAVPDAVDLLIDVARLHAFPDGVSDFLLRRRLVLTAELKAHGVIYGERHALLRVPPHVLRDGLSDAGLGKLLPEH